MTKKKAETKWDSKRRGKLLRVFSSLYPDPESELNFGDDFQLVVCVMLSAQCTDKKVNEVSPALFAAYPDFEEMSRAELSDVEKIIRPINYYRTKAKHLIAMSKKVLDEFGGELPKTHEGLTSLPGVGRKTANVILSERGIEPAFPVDTHVYRVAHRLGLSSAKNRDLVEADLKDHFKPQHWRNLHHWLIFHGRRVCKAQRPLCSDCKVGGLCPLHPG